MMTIGLIAIEHRFTLYRTSYIVNKTLSWEMYWVWIKCLKKKTGENLLVLGEELQVSSFHSLRYSSYSGLNCHQIFPTVQAWFDRRFQEPQTEDIHNRFNHQLPKPPQNGLIWQKIQEFLLWLKIVHDWKN